MIKNIFNFIISLFIFVFISPIMLLISLGIFYKLGQPIIFCQMRIGLYGNPFKLYKFRTMLNSRNESGELLPDSDRITKLGAFLRKTSLDELPSFWNVLKGDMNLVGPRPLILEYLPLYNEEQAHRHNIKPGITGWAQINGRNKISWKKKFELDVWYVNNQSILLDIKILLLTIYKILKQEGINQKDDVTMEVFTGN